MEKKKLNKLQEARQKRESVAILLGGKCAVCSKKFGKAFHFHHLKYRKGEKTYKDFETHKSIKNWIDYTNYVVPIIKKYPKEFALLCQKHHKLVEILVALKDIRYRRLIEVVRRTRND